jgi:CheY-like chemotaxis protein
MSSSTAPEDDAPAAQSLDNDPEAAQTSQVLRVLIADDFDVVRELMRRMLEKLGHVVDEVEDGQEAIEAITARHYDLLLLDLMMPRMSGIDVARWLKAHPEHLEGMTVAANFERAGH